LGHNEKALFCSVTLDATKILEKKYEGSMKEYERRYE
jgi:hypothetical protein